MTDPSETARDIHSFARPADARVTHVALDLRANFTDKRLSGTATLTLERRPGATELVLDTRDLDILGVADRGGATLTYALADPDPILGRALTVTLPAQTNAIVVSYRTGARSRRAAVACAVTDGGKTASVSVLAGRSDPDPHMDSYAG